MWQNRQLVGANVFVGQGKVCHYVWFKLMICWWYEQKKIPIVDTQYVLRDQKLKSSTETGSTRNGNKKRILWAKTSMTLDSLEALQNWRDGSKPQFSNWELAIAGCSPTCAAWRYLTQLNAHVAWKAKTQNTSFKFNTSLPSQVKDHA